jgi:hypothetical protein
MKKSLCSLESRIIAFVIATSLLLADVAVAQVCLLPVKPNNEPIVRIYPTSEGVFLLTRQGIRPFKGSHELKPAILDLAEGRVIKVATVCDTPEGVFFIGSLNEGFYRYIDDHSAERLLDGAQRNQLRGLRITSAGVFLLLSDQIYKIQENKQQIDVENQTDLSLAEVFDTGTDILFSTLCPASISNGCLYRLRGNRLAQIDAWKYEFGRVIGARTNRRGVFVGGERGVYRLGEDASVERVPGMPAETLVHELYEIAGEIFAVTNHGWFVLSAQGMLVKVADDTSGTVRSMHHLQSGFYLLAAEGVFHLTPTWELQRIQKDMVKTVIKQGTETRHGVFLQSSTTQTYLLTDDGTVVPLSSVDGTITDMVDTTVGALLVTDHAVYRFAQPNRWEPVPSRDLGNDISIVTSSLASEAQKRFCPDLRRDSASRSTSPVSGQVFIESSSGVFRWVNSPLDVRSLKDAWNYIAIFWRAVVIIVPALLLIGYVFVHYSLYRYRWLRYHILGLVAPSLVHNKIFINYRRDDSLGHALNLYEQLCRRFDRKLIFFDAARIEGGDMLPEKIHKAVENCSVLLALIGSDWLDAQKADGSRKLDDPNDYVRQEIALALERGKAVIPVLLGNVSMPEARCLPEPLKPLLDRLALKLGVEEPLPIYMADVDVLSRGLVRFPNIPPAKKS